MIFWLQDIVGMCTGWVVANKIFVTAQRPISPFPLDLTGTRTGTWPGACQYTVVVSLLFILT